MERVRAALAAHIPSCQPVVITKFGSGIDNVVFLVNGELILRASNENDAKRRADEVRREAELLHMVAEISPLQVPRPIFVDADHGVLAYRKLAGVPLNHFELLNPASLGPVLGEFLSNLHLAPTADIATLVPCEDEPLTAWREEADENYRQVADRVPSEARPLVQDFLDRPPPAAVGTLVFCHNDLGAEHLLFDPEMETLTGVIDWTDAAITDPAVDFGRLYRDFGPAALKAIVANYRAPWTAGTYERTVFFARCALLEDLAYGIHGGDRRYADAALAHLVRTFTQLA
jgi:aminoglycoside phosphotransferase (APT) family kinase protein